ncbi:hypothetical protein [cf. Phormidesmis sp. LEGE 11477]|uniref:hypothetical protein n=1 Tax=cf. Phormidesmis sp. LEGE 11477 TaxID=1828680 RepID=UPI00187F1C36|nr:hypothetical protein [cf. Phormidesmis sp. LEGE 11477]MBE9062190.1 hypothetical protein [cf. Phormidesmis sp. LEGE 11477]
MSDTTAYLAGCATTGVAALVLLVARVGMVSADGDAEQANRSGDRTAQIESATTQSQQALEAEIRRELDKQQTLTQALEEQLEEQETLSANLENQMQEQSEKTQDLLDRIQNYQRSVEDLELEDKIAAAVQPAAEANARPSGPPTSLIWLGAGIVIVLGLGGGGLILCSVILILQAQRRSVRPMPMRPMPMPPMPMPPTASNYYDPAFLSAPQLPPRRAPYYDYPAAPYDYTP